jgi:hypothetical protein
MRGSLLQCSYVFFGSGMAQREPVARIEASLPMDGQECARSGPSMPAPLTTASVPHDASSSSSALASCRTGVSKPSLNQP